MPITQAPPILVFENVTRLFDLRRGFFGERQTLVAVAGVSFTLRRGESLGLVGESGCGKSTLGRLACGLLSPSSGRTLFDGRPLPEAGAGSWASGRIQMIFQDPSSSLNPRRRAYSSIAEPLAARNSSRAERREKTEAMLEAVGLKGMGNRYPHEFSGGQRQRIAVARALVTHPDVVVCDEPVSSLDASVQAQILNLLRDVQERFAPAYLFISHDMAVVGFMCERVLVMYLGQIVEDAPRDALFTKAAHPYSQALLDSAPGGRWKKEFPPLLAGEPPSPLAPPPGCPFHPRCPKAAAICRTEAPAWKETSPGQRARCHRL
ncbi:MAG: ATP-binding cassette domain-containing protein [Desulfovibrio sp.]|jgi:peptide/nickel transport system ATP-binding protein|nr:ATP-binding cassette domain-containing protein [Desulfovibrio sp.]